MKGSSKIKILGLALSLALSMVQFSNAEAKRPECIAPAQPGGGFDLTCKLVQSGFKDTGLITAPIRVTYMPGGVGAVAYNRVIANRNNDANAIVAFSTGSLLNIAQGKFGKYTVNDVKWLAAIGTDYGAVSVKADSELKTLADLVEALKKDPKSIVIGAGGSVGGQDWLQVALLGKATGFDVKNISYVALEGGGEIVTNLLGGHINVMSSGIAEMVPYVESGDMRVLAIFSNDRIGGVLSEIPTAKEQGYDVLWPVIRGFYMGPKVKEKDFEWWEKKFNELLASKQFDELRTQRDLLPFAMTGKELDEYVEKQVKDLEEISKEFGLIQ